MQTNIMKLHLHDYAILKAGSVIYIPDPNNKEGETKTLIVRLDKDVHACLAGDVFVEIA